MHTIPGHPYLQTKNHATKGINPQMHIGGGVMPHMTVDDSHPMIHSPNMKLGGGGRFAALKNKLSHQKGIYNPAGLAAAIGRKKYSGAKMAKMAAAGRKRG